MRSTSAPAAPSASAWATKACPSCFWPLSATKHAPGAICRESTTTREKRNSDGRAPRSSPRVAVMTSASVSTARPPSHAPSHPARETSHPAREASPPAREASPPAREGPPPAREASPPARESSPPAREPSPSPPAREPSPHAREASREPSWQCHNRALGVTQGVTCEHFTEQASREASQRGTSSVRRRDTVIGH